MQFRELARHSHTLLKLYSQTLMSLLCLMFTVTADVQSVSKQSLKQYDNQGDEMMLEEQISTCDSVKS